jgi:hypothetical protein
MTSNAPPSLVRRASQLVKASFRQPPSNFGDGTPDSAPDPKTLKAGIIKELASQSKRAPQNLQLLIQMIGMKAHGNYEDDSLYVVFPFIGMSSNIIVGTSHSACRFFAAFQAPDFNDNVVYRQPLEWTSSPPPFLFGRRLSIPCCGR